MICAFLAVSKGRNVLGWFVIGFLLPLVGIILVLVLPEEGAPRVHDEPKRTTSLYLDDLQKLADLRTEAFSPNKSSRTKKRLVMAAAPKSNVETVNTADVATNIPEVHQAEAKSMLAAAQKRHFAKEFVEAKRIYEELASRFPSSKQAAVARQQLVNLKDA